MQSTNGNPTRYYGVGSIDWRSDGARYRSDLFAAVDFLVVKLNVLASHSEGAITGAGLAPDRYTATPRRRSTVATSFNRDERQTITFSASANVVPLAPGAQDRLSVIFQVGAWIRGDPQLVQAGRRIDVPVAGVRGDVDTWSFESLGIEPIEAGLGRVEATHLRRVPRPDSNDRVIDVWIAHADGGYPARVVYTEKNGDTVAMMLERIEALTEK